MELDLLSQINFFRNKSIKLLSDIYLDDKYPCCYLIETEQKYYKVRTPSRFNNRAIINEYLALNMLADTLSDRIPSVIERGYCSSGFSYIVETYMPGKSLDKFSSIEIIKNKEQIKKQLLSFMDCIYDINTVGYGELDAPFYSNYSKWLLNRISMHLTYHRQAKFIPVEMLEKIFKIFDNTIIFEKGVPHFLHFDIKPQNLVYDTVSEKLYFIDFEHSRFGDIEHELYRARQRFTLFPNCMKLILEPVLQLFLKKHQIVLSEEKINLFSLYYYISEMTYLLKANEVSYAETYMQRLQEKMSEIF